MLLILHDLCQAYEDDMAEMYRKLGKQVYEEARLQELYTGMGLDRSEEAVGRLQQEYGELRERGLAIAQRVAKHAEEKVVEQVILLNTTTLLHSTPLQCTALHCSWRLKRPPATSATPASPPPRSGYLITEP
jgi:hypothetical protein